MIKNVTVLNWTESGLSGYVAVSRVLDVYCDKAGAMLWSDWLGSSDNVVHIAFLS